MILAAGRGERMRPLTDDTPKPMLKVNGKPLIQYHVENLVQAGISDIVINHAIFGDQIEDYLGDGKQWSADIAYSPEGDAPLETAGGIIKALPLLGDGPFVVVNADVWTDFPFQSLVNSSSTIYSPYIVLVDNPEHNPQGDFSLEEEKVRNQGDSMMTFSGISLLNSEFFMDQGAGEEALAPLLRAAAETGQLRGQHYRGEWFDIGTPQRLEYLQSYLNK